MVPNDYIIGLRAEIDTENESIHLDIERRVGQDPDISNENSLFEKEVKLRNTNKGEGSEGTFTMYHPETHKKEKYTLVAINTGHNIKIHIYPKYGKGYITKETITRIMEEDKENYEFIKR